MYVEAAIDFPEEEIDFLSDERVSSELEQCIQSVRETLSEAKRGQVLNDGVQMVLAGPPNAGKSSLLNFLAGQDRAIVSDTPGTTRDVVRETVTLDGLTLFVSDTAGLRASDDHVEREGIKRSQKEIERANIIVMLFAVDQCPENIQEWWQTHTECPWPTQPVIIVKNKIDLVGAQPTSSSFTEDGATQVLSCSIQKHQGLDKLIAVIKDAVGFQVHEGQFSARRRHVMALERCLDGLKVGQRQLLEHHAGELLAEDLRDAAHALGEITGTMTPDDLLGEIFSSFCIGK